MIDFKGGLLIVNEAPCKSINDEMKSVHESQEIAEKALEEFLNTTPPAPVHLFTNRSFSHENVFKSINFEITIKGIDGDVKVTDVKKLIEILTENYYRDVCDVIKLKIQKDAS